MSFEDLPIEVGVVHEGERIRKADMQVELGGPKIAKKFELVKITGAATGEIPFKYVGILHLNSLDEFRQKDATSQKFQDFLAKWTPMVKNFHILQGEEIY